MQIEARACLKDLDRLIAEAKRLRAVASRELAGAVRGGGDPHRNAYVVRWIRDQMRGLVHGRVTPNDEVLAHEVLCRLRLRAYRSKVMKLPADLLEELCRQLVRSGPDRRSTLDWLNRHLGPPLEVDPIPRTTFYAFAERFLHEVEQLRDRFLGLPLARPLTTQSAP